uniref:methylcrotonoyl-CoA carboxylase n=1 Tax=Eptatretus burgeri TaxID=7764 RepID=A0A8C4R120_EPTBU
HMNICLSCACEQVANRCSSERSLTFDSQTFHRLYDQTELELRTLNCPEKSCTEGGIIHVERNRKLLVHDRLSLLLDPGAPFLELSPLELEHRERPFVPSCLCLGKVGGLWCGVVANDATVKGGTAFPITVAKQLRAQEVAKACGVPMVYVVDSGGAYLPLTFYNEAIMSAAGLAQVAIVVGSCTAGGAYIPTMADEAVMVSGIGSLFLAGPPLVRAATGENVSAEQLGGAHLHASISGCVDHFAENEAEGFAMVRAAIQTLAPMSISRKVPGSSPKADNTEPPLYSAEELPGLAPKSYRHSLDPRLIIARLVDGSRLFEFKSRYGPTLLTGFAHIDSWPLGILANYGELTYAAALKGSHFVRLCEQAEIPILFLTHTAPPPIHPLDITTAEALKAQGTMMATVACSRVPKITIVTGNAYGAQSYAMCSRAFSPHFLFLWPNASICMVDPDQMTCVGQKELRERLHVESSAFYSTARLWDDGVLQPQNTRPVLSQCLQIFAQKRSSPHPHFHGPILRF